MRPRELGGLEELFQAYGIRYFTAAKIAELGFTVNTLLDMRDEELDEMMNSLCQIFRWDLLVGERYGIKAAVRAERRRLDEEEARRRHLLSGDASHALDALSQEGLSEEPVQQEKEAAGSGGGGVWEMVVAGGRKQRRRKNCSRGRSRMASMEEDDDEDDETEGAEDDENCGGGGGNERQREHPFIVTEPGEVARGKKNGLDYLFHLYEQCREFLIQVQNIAKERGEKCPTKVTNQVFRYAKKAGANYINKPKMRHYVHCYALHCLDEETSNVLRRAFKERGENVGAWRQACYKPLVAVAARQGWDIDAIFNAHPRLSIWYVPTKLRQLCHAERSSAAASSSITAAGVDHLPF
ncbi:floral meristem identity control protein LEAFY [Perilla frutescens var. hirtella]|nr:floral meristem identity control protein LEAFY [Perilla frutescens var. hirtella]